MRLVLQRVKRASVAVEDQTIASIGPGLLVFVGVFPEDGPEQVDWLADKILDLRIFPDEYKPMNRSVMDVGGALLLVSQFTLAADLSRGKRPGFSSAAKPEIAEPLFEQLVARLRARWSDVQTGRFGADMQIELVNDGPVTFLLER